MGLRKIIKDKLYVHYLKKGMVKAIRELEDQWKRDQEHIAGAVEHINKSIGMMKDEVDMFLEAIELVEAKYGKNSEAAEIATVFPFLALSMLDIFILFRQYMTTKDAVEKNFICRTAAQHMYEFLEDGARATGKQMNLLTKELESRQVDEKLKELRKMFNDMKERLHEPLKKLRHNVSGHKDRDIKVQISLSKGIDTDNFGEYFFQFMHFFIALTVFKRLVVDEIKMKQGEQ